MFKRTGKYIVPGLIAAAGVFFAVYTATHYPMYSPTQGPLQGFLPTLLGVLLAISGAAAAFQARHEEDKGLDLKNWSIVLAVALMLVGNALIGTILSVALFLVLWLKCVEKYSWKTVLLVTAIMMAFVVGVFYLWMDIPFTQGLLFEAILG